MSAFADLRAFCNTRLLLLNEDQFDGFVSDAARRALSDFNVGQVFSFDGEHYAVPNPPSATREEFHALRAAWQTEQGAEGG